MALAKQSAKHHGVDTGPLLIHILGLVSSLAGATVRSMRTGGQMEPALLSMTVVSEDDAIPAWVSNEWKLTHDAGNSGISVFEKISRDKLQQAKRRRHQRMMAYLDPSGTILEEMVARAFLGEPIVRRFGSIRNYAPPGPPRQELRPHSLTHMAAATNQVRRALACIEAESGGAKRPENQLFWLRPKGLETLMHEQEPGRIAHFGLLAYAGQSIEHPPEDHPLPLCAFVLHMLMALSFDNPVSCYHPTEEIAALLDQHQSSLSAILVRQTATHGCTGLPADLAWQFATLLHATCLGNRNTDSHLSLASGRLALSLADCAARSHAYTLNRCLPADEQGRFEGDELRIIRVLDRIPVTIREIQRSLKGIRKSVILPALDRAERAGLVIKHSENRHALAPPPNTGLSEIPELQDS